MTIKETHNCTKCNKLLTYTNKGSWFNAKKRKEDRGSLLCKPCQDENARIVNKNNPKITGRPKGSKTSPEKLINHSRPGAGKRLNKIKETTAYGKWLDNTIKTRGWKSWEDYTTNIKGYKQYRTNVLRITNQQPLHLLEHFEKRGVNGQIGAYTLDHIISVKRGFIENIPAEKIGDISNLQMLPWEENITKGWK